MGGKLRDPDRRKGAEIGLEREAQLAKFESRELNSVRCKANKCYRRRESIGECDDRICEAVLLVGQSVFVQESIKLDVAAGEVSE